MTSTLIKKGNLHTQIHTGKTLSADEGRDRGGASTSRGKSEMCQPTTSSRESGLGQIPLTASEGTHPSDIVILEL